ncbi:MAG TPA: NUDIX domain-containing protein [Patescibacteria group bacterium]|nr:NUDIX domain-containing protein [Patescibacteria group bacterium]
MENGNKQIIKVGIGVMIVKDGKVLLGKRKGSHGDGEYAFPGGHFEYGESFENSILREVAEECGIKIKNLRFQMVSNFKNYMPKHYVHIGFLADWESGDPQLLEPEKCEGWIWYDIDDLPSPLFGTAPIAIESYKTGRVYFDA